MIQSAQNVPLEDIAKASLIGVPPSIIEVSTLIYKIHRMWAYETYRKKALENQTNLLVQLASSALSILTPSSHSYTLTARTALILHCAIQYQKSASNFKKCFDRFKEAVHNQYPIEIKGIKKINIYFIDSATVFTLEIKIQKTLKHISTLVIIYFEFVAKTFEMVNWLTLLMSALSLKEDELAKHTLGPNLKSLFDEVQPFIRNNKRLVDVLFPNSQWFKEKEVSLDDLDFIQIPNELVEVPLWFLRTSYNFISTLNFSSQPALGNRQITPLPYNDKSTKIIPYENANY